MNSLFPKRITPFLLGLSLSFGGNIAGMSTGAFAADMELKPFIAVSEEYNDNIYQTKDHRRYEFITWLQPGASFRYSAPLWNWDLAYSFDYRNYARNSKGDEYNHDLGLKGNISLLDNFFYLDVSDRYHRVSLDITRDVTQESPFVNQTDQNIASISPYLLWRPGEKTSLKTGYRYIDTRYWGAGIEKREHDAFADLNHAVSSKFSLLAGYVFTRLETHPVRFDRHDLYGGFRFEYADKSFLFGQVGNSWQQFDTGVDVNYLFWNAGISHDFSTVVATLETRVSTTEDPLAVSTRETSYSAKLDKALQRGMIGLSAAYTEYVNNETDEQDRRKLSFGTTGRYEIGQNLTATLAATGEKFSRQTTAEYPYRLSAVGGLNYALNNGVTLGLNHTYVSYRYALDTTVGSKDINRVVVEVRKVF